MLELYGFSFWLLKLQLYRRLKWDLHAVICSIWQTLWPVSTDIGGRRIIPLMRRLKTLPLTQVRASHAAIENILQGSMYATHTGTILGGKIPTISRPPVLWFFRCGSFNARRFEVDINHKIQKLANCVAREWGFLHATEIKFGDPEIDNNFRGDEHGYVDGVSHTGYYKKSNCRKKGHYVATRCLVILPITLFGWSNFIITNPPVKIDWGIFLSKYFALPN